MTGRTSPERQARTSPDNDADSLIARLRGVVGRRHVITGTLGKTPFCRGFRSGTGEALAVVRPGSLTELWSVLEHCVAADVAMVMQAANTGLTGGSTPVTGYDRPAIVVSTLRIDRVIPILGGTQAICFAGSTLQGLETMLKPMGRQPHSVLGSSCIGASVVGGICNNSGGALVERGPAYTELSLYARITASGKVEFVNALGIELGDSPIEILRRLESEDFGKAEINTDDRLASDREYAGRVRDIESPEPARFNADQRRLNEASGCAGKLAVFAVRVDTFQKYESEKTFFVSASEPGQLTQVRRRLLADAESLPVFAEYIHRQTLELAREFGNDTVWLIHMLGTRRIPVLFRLRSRMEALASRIPGVSDTIVDQVLQVLCSLLPSRLPPKVVEAMSASDHHLILRAHDDGIDETQAILEALRDEVGLRFLRCEPDEADSLSLYRFAAAGAAIRYEVCHRSAVGGLVALDIALPRNETDWFEQLPPQLDAKIHRKLCYGHFLCHVMHQDYLVKAGEDVGQVKDELLAFMEARGARYPAEHNYGHTYEAPPELQSFYAQLDPGNALNPGIGGMSKRKDYA